MGFHPLKARLTGQFLLLDLSTPKGALHSAGHLCPSLSLSLSNSRSTFNRSWACREPAMKPTAGLSRLDPDCARLTLPIPGSAFRPVPTPKWAAIPIESYFTHRDTS
jgi:hypothetical protein